MVVVSLICIGFIAVIGAILSGATAADTLTLLKNERRLRRAGTRVPSFAALDEFPGIAVRIGRPPRRTARDRARLAIRIAVLSITGVVGGGLAIIARDVARIDRYPLRLATGTGGARNYLFVGSDERSAAELDELRRSGIEAPEGRRTDALLVVRVDRVAGDIRMLSIPRDLMVERRDSGEYDRINALAASDRQLLVDAVSDLGVPVHHYIEVRFNGFHRMIDRLGGLSLSTNVPLDDDWTGLVMPRIPRHIRRSRFGAARNDRSSSVSTSCWRLDRSWSRPSSSTHSAPV